MKNLLTLKTFCDRLSTMLPLVGILILSAPSSEIFPTRWQLKPAQASTLEYSFEQTSRENTPENLAKAIASSLERIKRNPQDGLDRAILANTYLKMARLTGDDSWYAKAEESAQQSLLNLPFNNDGALVALAKVAEAQHDFQTAIQYAQKASSTEAIAILITSKLAIGELQEASGLAENLVDLTPSLGSLTLKALTQSAQGKDQEAIENLQKAIALEQPDETRASALARSLLGYLYYKQGNHHLAEPLYREALKIVPNYPQALLNMGELKTRQEDYQQAEKFYTLIDDPLAQLGLARVQALQGKETFAQKQWQATELILREKVAANPLDHGRELAELLLERGNPADLPEAIALTEAEVKHRRDAKTLNTLAWALSRAQRWQEAQLIMKEIMAQGFQDAEIFYRAGLIEQALSNFDQGNHYFQLAQNFDPTFIPQQSLKFS